MTMCRVSSLRALCLLLTVLCVDALPLSSASARDAAFVDPGSSTGTVAASDAIRVEPKNEIDLGDSAQNVARRTTLFFVNQTNAPIKIEKTTINSDSNVTAEIANDDCSKQQTLIPSSRCSVEIVLTPTAAGTWSAEIMMTHNGAGRLTRAKISGRTAGASSAEKKDSGLFLSAKEVKPVDFGEVNVGEGKMVRSALMVNDSPTPITLYSIDVIEADNGLQRLDQGCAVDMELKPGESCPVTLIWVPTEHGRISTDLIIRHSGQLGFAVIPIRGIANGNTSNENSKDSKTTAVEEPKSVSQTSRAAVPPPPSVAELGNIENKVLPVSASALAASSKAVNGTIHLIGTVGNRVLLYKPDGSTIVAQAGDDVSFDTRKITVKDVGSKDADIIIDGKVKKLNLEAVQELTDKAKNIRQQNQESPTRPAAESASGSKGSTLSPLEGMGLPGLPVGSSGSGK